MNEQSVMTALALERKRYSALTEVMELTEELSQALQRQDQVSVQMFLRMRQEPVNQLREYQALERKQQAELSEEDAQELKGLLSGDGVGQTSQAQSLARLAGQNRNLLERVLRADRQISVRLGGKKSFYQQRNRRP